MRKGLIALEWLIVVDILAILALIFVPEVNKRAMHNRCLLAGYPDMRSSAMMFPTEHDTFCVKRVDQTDVVVRVIDIPK